jgi:hypothetical protein
MKKLIISIAALSAVIGLTGVEAQSVQAQDVAIYRLYNKDLKEHLYTSDQHERDVLYTQAGWGDEGVAWYAPTSGNGTPVYRLYNAQLKNHLYTTDLNEVNILTSQHGWTRDNNGQPLFYSGGSANIYRLYSAGLNGMHMLTTDTNEYNILARSTWSGEGVKLKASRVGTPSQTKYLHPTTTGNSPLMKNIVTTLQSQMPKLNDNVASFTVSEGTDNTLVLNIRFNMVVTPTVLETLQPDMTSNLQPVVNNAKQHIPGFKIQVNFYSNNGALAGSSTLQ